MNKSERHKFRRSSVWRKWRLFVKKFYKCRDYITGLKLTRTWNCHHMCMNPTKYDDISDIDNFIPLNEDTHKFIHWLYNLWKYDHDIILRIKQVLDKMEELNARKTQ